MVLKAVFTLCFVLFCSSASAQVYRCTDPVTKKITYSDALCVDGRQIERRRSAEEQVLDAERADIARQRFQLRQESNALRQQQASTPSQPMASPSTSGSSYECQVAQKNAWGANKAQKQREADIICYGPERAARIQAEKAANRPVATTCVHNGRFSNCVSR